MSNKTYPYDSRFQSIVLSLCLREPTFLPSYNAIIQSEYFDSEIHSILIRLILEHFDSSYTIPTHHDIELMIADYCREQKLDNKLREVLLTTLGDAYKVDPSDAKTVQDKVVEFGKAKLIEKIAFEAANMVSKNVPSDHVWEMIDKYRNTGVASADTGINIGEKFLDAAVICGQDGMFSQSMKIMTGIPTLDQIFNGGLGKKELGIVLGYTGLGKSLCLVNLGAAAVIQRLPVVHLSIGELEESDLLARYTSRWTGFSIHEIVSGVVEDDFNQKAKEFYEVFHPQLIAKYFPPYTSIGAVRNFLSVVKYRLGVSPELVIIDNADDLSPGYKRKGETYDELGDVYIGLKSIAHDFNVAMWADSQTNRSGLSREVANLDVMSDSFKKARKADVIISINQNEDDRKNNEMRIFIAKSRRYGHTSQVITCKLEPEKMKLTEKT
jgi:replicative DNA helicase